MNQPVAKWLKEAAFAIIFALAVVFMYRMYASSAKSPARVNEFAREGTNVSEVTNEEEYEKVQNILDVGIVVDGASLYYEVTGYNIYYTSAGADNETKVAIKINDNDVTDDVLAAQDGSPEELMKHIDKSASYKKTCVVDNGGNIIGITYDKQ